MTEVRSLKELERVMKALSNPIRLQIVGSLASEPKHIYALAKELNLSYPLVHLYLESLEKVGLVEGTLGSGPSDQRERKFYKTADFKFELTPKVLKELYKEEEKDG